MNATRICILSAKGVTADGKVEMLGFERVSRENTESWRGFLNRLVGRGVRPEDLSLVISDEHKGIQAAVAEVFGDVAHQLCWAHRMRNVRKAVKVCDRKAVVEGLQKVYQAQHLVAAKAAFKVWAARWRVEYPNVVQSVGEDLGSLLAFFQMDPLHWEYIRTSNPIERSFRELRRQQFGCGAFANRDACNRAVFRVFFWLNERWKDKDIWQKARQKQMMESKTK